MMDLDKLITYSFLTGIAVLVVSVLALVSVSCIG